MTLEDGGTTVTYRLRGVERDADPSSEFATVMLEPIRTLAAEVDRPEEAAS